MVTQDDMNEFIDVLSAACVGVSLPTSREAADAPPFTEAQEVRIREIMRECFREEMRRFQERYS